MFNEIMALVHDRSTEKRTALFRMVSDLFAEDAAVHSDRELVLFGDVLGRLLDQVAITERASFSARVARMTSTPRTVALRLADDDDDVAAPMLELSPVLTEADLIDVATRKGNGHRVAIARRPGIGEAVTDVLVDRGDGEVLTTVSANLGARFSHRSMAILTERASVNQRVAEALALRTDVPAAMADALLKLIGPAGRSRIETLLKAEPSRLDAVIGAAGREVDEARDTVKRNRVEVLAMAEAIRRGRRNIDAVVDSLLNQRRVLDIALLLADLCDVPEAHVTSVLFKLDSQPIAVLARVAGLGELTYARLTRLRCERLNLAGSQEAHMMGVYRDTDSGEANRALDFHRRRRLSV